MAAPATEHVRNIVLVGQDGAGKTSLAEAMLHVSGRTPRMGTTHDGKSYLDYDDEEIRRKFTIGTSIAPIPYKDYKINLLDTSGHPDFIGDTLATMQAAEMALFVVDAVAGPQVMTTKLWREAEDMRLSRAVFINHIDRENADFDTAMALLHARFGSRLGPVTIPIGVDKDFEGVIDIIRMKARYFDAGSEKERIEEIPPEYADAAQAARDKLCDLVAEADDDLMMKYLDGEEQLTQDELEQLLDKAIAQELFIPVFVGSTIIEQGIQGVMEDIATYFPHPRHHGRFRLANGEETFVDETGEPAAFIFKTVSDPFVGRLSFLKVISGVLEPGMELINARTGQEGPAGPPLRDDGQGGHRREEREGRRHHRGAEAHRYACRRHDVEVGRRGHRPLAAARPPVPGGHRGGEQEGRGQAGNVPGSRGRERPHADHQP